MHIHRDRSAVLHPNLTPSRPRTDLHRPRNLPHTDHAPHLHLGRSSAARVRRQTRMYSALPGQRGPLRSTRPGMSTIHGCLPEPS